VTQIVDSAVDSSSSELTGLEAGAPAGGEAPAAGEGLGPLEAEAARLMERARAEGVSLVGPGGLLAGLTKNLLESALEAELEDHVGYGPYEVAGRNSGNSRNGSRSKRLSRNFMQRGGFL
jgi:hypothetical protein